MSEKFVTYTMDDALMAVADLKDYCENEAGFEAKISAEQYPIEIILTPADEQLDMLGEVGHATAPDGNIVIVAGAETKLDSTLPFKMPAPVLKKILSKSAKVATAYLHAFRAAAQELLDNGDASAIRLLQERI